MKKILIVAALLATTVVPATPSFAATMAAPAASGVTCFFLPLLPDCQQMWKDHMAEWKSKMSAKMTMPAMTMPAMGKGMGMMGMGKMMPNCAKAPAGAGHLLDCKM
jgi:hypothetical protein